MFLVVPEAGVLELVFQEQLETQNILEYDKLLRVLLFGNSYTLNKIRTICFIGSRCDMKIKR